MKRRIKVWGFLALAGLVLTLVLGWFSSRDFRYVVTAAVDHLRLMAARRPIRVVIDAPETSDVVRGKLDLLLRARRFASGVLGLPDNGSYTTYVEVGRPELAWNVFATPELSTRALEWCFPVVGCVVYRGYFAEEDAREFASGLREEGHDVYVSRVTAYSTLGWFEDPVLSTFIDLRAEDLAALVFHELAHQRLYIPGDSAFNESFAVTVEREAMRQWLGSQGRKEALAQVVARWAARDARTALMLETREALEGLFASELTDDEKRDRKAELFGELQEALCALAGDCESQTLRRSAGGDVRTINNASLVAVGTYHGYVPGFVELLTEANGDLTRFYNLAEKVGARPAEERKEYLMAQRGQ